MSFYHFANYRTEEQLAEMRRLDAAGICLFCPGQLEKIHDQEVVHNTEQWTVTHNRFPYRNAELHLLLVPCEHITDMADLPVAAQTDLFTVLGWVRAKYGLDYYGLGVRCGDLAISGSTIKHLHLHVIVGNRHGEPVKFKMSQPPRSQLDPDQVDAGLA